MTAVSASRQSSRRSAETKSSLWRNSPLFAWCKNAYYLWFALCKGLVPALWRGDRERKRRWLSWKVPIPQVEDAEQLIAWLEARGAPVVDAEHAVYLPPHSALREVFPELADFYPQGSGFKILKHFRGPAEANYLAGRPGSVFIRRRLAGSASEQLITANYMHRLGLGPRVFDVCELRGEQQKFTAFVVEHIEGDVPSPAECRAFLERLQQIDRQSHLRILMPNWQQQDDFDCPACRGNLFRSQEDGRLHYVDFQNFRLTDPKRWMREIFSQTSMREDGGPSDGPKETEASAWWDLATHKLRAIGIDLDGRVVMHRGCGLGELLAAALAGGAGWALGWTSGKDLDSAEDFLWSRGVGRFTLSPEENFEAEDFGCTVSPGLRQRLSESVVFCELRHEDPGLVRFLKTMPWRVLVVRCDKAGPRDRAARLLGAAFLGQDDVLQTVDVDTCSEGVLVVRNGDIR